MTRILSGDGSAWLRDLNKEPNDMPQFQSNHAARERQQQSARRLEHHRWQHEEPGMQVSWQMAVAIAFIIIIVVVGQFGDLRTLFGG